jgi:hypothetical protein
MLAEVIIIGAIVALFGWSLWGDLHEDVDEFTKEIMEPKDKFDEEVTK